MNPRKITRAIDMAEIKEYIADVYSTWESEAKKIYTYMYIWKEKAIV
jgi:hypothetical protein